jgi:hypothetical protein
VAHEPYLRVLTHRSPIDKLYKTFKSPIYVFYLTPIFKVENRKHYQTFKCAAKECRTGGHIVKRNMDTGDATSTSCYNTNGLSHYATQIHRTTLVYFYFTYLFHFTTHPSLLYDTYANPLPLPRSYLPFAQLP